MLKSLDKSSCFKKLRVEINNLNHAYLFYSKDRVLNDNIAELFAMSIFCEEKRPCYKCDACKKMEYNKNPDLILVDKLNIVVEDVLKILETAQLKPMIYPYKVVMIKNADNINDIAQNKLLKVLEEPNDSLIFIFTTTNEEKLLPTVRSRMKKIFLSIDNIDCVREELVQQGVNAKFINDDYSITEMIENTNNKDYQTFLENVVICAKNLKTTSDIPKCVNGLKLNSQNKFVYIELFSKLFNSIKKENSVFDISVENYLKQEYNIVLAVRIGEFIEDAYKKLKSNVNPNYVFDTLLYNILKEKYLCK